MKIFLNYRETIFSFIYISLLIPAGAIITPAFPASVSDNLLSAEKLTVNSQQVTNCWGGIARCFTHGRTDRVDLGANPRGELHESDAKTDINLPIATFNENQKPELREHNSAASSDVGASDGGL